MYDEQRKTGLEVYAEGMVLTGSLLHDVGAFFKLHDDLATWDHTLKVTSHAVRIARLYDVDPMQAEQAALLHDISNVIPVSLFLEAASKADITVLEEELSYPRIIQQKLSRAMAEQLFELNDPQVLEAIACHTTLRAAASPLAKVVFIADKVAWEQAEEHAYLNEIRQHVDEGQLDEAILVYLNHVWSQRDKLRLVHSDLIQARAEMIEHREATLDPGKHNLRRMFRHMDWSNQQILEILEREQSVADRVVKLFAHILSAESIWISRIEGMKAQTPVWPDHMQPEDLRILATENEERFSAYLDTVTSEQLREPITYVTGTRAEFTTEPVDILMHVALHGSYHRGQIAALLRADEISPPSTDYIQYVRQLERK